MPKLTHDRITDEEKQVPTGKYEQELRELLNVLRGYDCTTYAEIGALTEWNVGKVADVLVHIRKPEVALEHGWTVPHVPRGPGDHLYQAIQIDGDMLNQEQFKHIAWGAVSTLRYTATTNYREANALRMTLPLVSAADAKRLRRTIQAHEGAAALAEDMAEQLAASLNQNHQARATA